MRLAGWALAAIVAAMGAVEAYPQELACERCHPEESRSQPLTPMARAAVRAANAEILEKRPALRASIGGYTYAIVKHGARVTYTVSGAGKTLTADLQWAFGFGSMGQTYLYEYRGAVYESQVSFYKALNGLDLTIGHRQQVEANIELAAGRRVDKFEAGRCFGCHTTGDAPGVRCERCHVGASDHARSFASGAQSSVPPKLARLGAEEMSSMCGECHRTWQEVETNGPHDINNVRFQPYRLATSKCFNASGDDRRISCVGCHDPHGNTVTSAAYYDSKCLDCHTAGARVCKVGQSGCVACHMPKVDFPGGHFQFTDHRIRIARGGGYPN